MALSFDENAKEGDTVILFSKMDDMKIVELKKGGTLNTKFGNFFHDDMISKPFGSRIPSRKSSGFVVMLQLAPDLITESLTHRTQILYHADISTILAFLDARPGKVILESGTGSASLSCHLAQAVAPNGKLHTCEFHEERYRKATEEFQTYGLSSVVQTYHRDVCSEGFPPCLYSGTDESNSSAGVEPSSAASVSDSTNPTVDSCFLDLPSPWLALRHADRCLKPGGRIIVFSPCIEQVQRNCELLRELEYQDIRTYECLAKPWNVRYTEIGKDTNPSKQCTPKGKRKAADAACTSEDRDLKKQKVDKEEGGVEGKDEKQSDAEEKNKTNGSVMQSVNKLPDIDIESVVSYQVGMRGHTGYLSFAIKSPPGERMMPP